MSYEHIILDISEGIATITLNRPDALNALSKQMNQDLTQAFAEIRPQLGDTVKAVIITGAGRAFCAGGDVKSMNEGGRTRGAVAGRQGLREAHNRMYDLMNLEAPVIALVDGPAAGAGANIALAADFVLATPRAMFMQAFGRIGLIPDWSGLYILPRLVGLQRAKDLVFTARKVKAEEALEMGLIYRIVPQEGAMAAAREFAGRFRNASTNAIGAAKVILNQSHNLDHRSLLEQEAQAQGILFTDDYHAQAVQRFADKQPALFDWDALEKAQTTSQATSQAAE